MAYFFRIGRNFECVSQTKLVVELELGLIKRYLSCGFYNVLEGIPLCQG